MVAISSKHTGNVERESEKAILNKRELGAAEEPLPGTITATPSGPLGGGDKKSKKV